MTPATFKFHQTVLRMLKTLVSAYEEWLKDSKDN